MPTLIAAIDARGALIGGQDFQRGAEMVVGGSRSIVREIEQVTRTMDEMRAAQERAENQARVSGDSVADVSREYSRQIEQQQAKLHGLVEEQMRTSESSARLAGSMDDVKRKSFGLDDVFSAIIRKSPLLIGADLIARVAGFHNVMDALGKGLDVVSGGIVKFGQDLLGIDRSALVATKSLEEFRKTHEKLLQQGMVDIGFGALVNTEAADPLSDDRAFELAKGAAIQAAMAHMKVVAGSAEAQNKIAQDLYKEITALRIKRDMGRSQGELDVDALSSKGPGFSDAAAVEASQSYLDMLYEEWSRAPEETDWDNFFAKGPGFSDAAAVEASESYVKMLNEALSAQSNELDVDAFFSKGSGIVSPKAVSDAEGVTAALSLLSESGTFGPSKVAEELNRLAAAREKDAAAAREEAKASEELLKDFSLEYEREKLLNQVREEAAEQRRAEAEATAEQRQEIEAYSLSMRSFLSGLETGAIKGSEALKHLLQMLSQLALDKLVNKPLGDAFGNFFGSLFGGAGLTPSATDGGGGSFDGSGSGGGQYAQGGVFAGGRVTAFAGGGIFGGPTLFPMANGWGLAGEAGPEAVMPLKRGSTGKLGVSAEGVRPTVVNMTVYAEDAGSFHKSRRQIMSDLQRGMR